MTDLRRTLREGRAQLPAIGEVRCARPPHVSPYVVVIDDLDIDAIAGYLASLSLSDASALTVKSYAYDLLRWWKVLSALNIPWDRAVRDDVEVLVGWMRSASNPQRRRAGTSTVPSGSVNTTTGKPTLSAGYAPSTINHALTVMHSFYEYHHLYGRGPIVNPVPAAVDRQRDERRTLPRHSPRRSALRQKQSQRAPRSIPDAMWDQLVATMPHVRDRALLEFAVSSGARASELLGVRGSQVEWGENRFWVVSKGTRDHVPLPASPTAFGLLAAYFDACGTPVSGDPIWRTLRGQPRPLTYWALRRVLQRANDVLATNWTFHDIRHTAAARMAQDPKLTLPEVQTILRHRHLSTTETYLVPRLDELHEKMQEHYERHREPIAFSAGYAAEDIATVFGE